MADEEKELPENATADATKWAEAQNAQKYADSFPGGVRPDVDPTVDLDTWEPQSQPAEVYPVESDLEKDLGHLLNKHSAENESGTPDFILAMYLKAQLDLFNQTIKNRAAWRGEEVELPALISLHREQEQIEATMAQVRTLIANGIVHLDAKFENSDLYRHLKDSADVHEVPLVMYNDGRRNEIGTARVDIRPGEALVTGTITGAVAMFAPGVPDQKYAADTNLLGDAPLNEPKDEPRPTTRFERYQKEGLNKNDD